MRFLHYLKYHIVIFVIYYCIGVTLSQLLFEENSSKKRYELSIIDEFPNNGINSRYSRSEGISKIQNKTNKLNSFQQQSRYVGYCTTSIVNMWPGNVRYFWSYGYVYLTEDYPADCVIDYTYVHRIDPINPYTSYGFEITGTFEGVFYSGSNCSDSDHLILEDTQGYTESYCGTNSNIHFTTGSNVFRLYFKSHANSPRGRGFKIKIQSVAYCGGQITNTVATGYIRSPRYPESYPSNVACMWFFTAPSKSRVVFTCGVFELNGYTDFLNGTILCNDVLTFSYEVGHLESAAYCADDLASNKHVIYSSATDSVVYFKSNNNINKIGFECYYEFITFSK